MAVLSDNDRAALAKLLMDKGGWTAAITKAGVRTLINDLDDWWEANQGAANSAISQPVRGQATTAEKARALVLILRQRFLEL